MTNKDVQDTFYSQIQDKIPYMRETYLKHINNPKLFNFQIEAIKQAGELAVRELACWPGRFSYLEEFARYSAANAAAEFIYRCELISEETA